MIPKYLTILEVSQKQAYIFASNKLKDNIRNSAVIAKVLSPEYLEEVLSAEGYSDAENMVYSGGGHTVLQFQSKEEAKKTVSAITENIYRKFDRLEVFAKTIDYDPEKNAGENLQELSKALEKKKSERKSSFKQGSYGIEVVDSNTLKPEPVNKKDVNLEKDIKKSLNDYIPEGYTAVDKFEKLGGSKNESSFIAVIHIDGNGMGARVNRFYENYEKSDWDTTVKKFREFSEAIDADFKAAFKKMADFVAANLEKGPLKDKLNLEGKNFPVRPVILAGDDICFVTEGRIGIECAAEFIRILSSMENEVDGQKYGACAGVAIVHQKYPFYRAYELAEMLCSNAKKEGAKLNPADNGASVSSIDWHIEFGEIKDSLGEIRKSYVNEDGESITLRPYIIQNNALVSDTDSMKTYESFQKAIKIILDDKSGYGAGKIKELRGILKKGKKETENYLAFNRMPFNREGIPNERRMDDMFDAIELMDTYIAMERSVK